VAVHSIVVFVAVPIVGGCVSTMVIVWLRVGEVLPHASIAFHALVIVLAQAVPPVTSLPTCCTVAPLQASFAVGGVNNGVAVHSIVAFAVVPIVGGCVSTIVIVSLRVGEVLPHASIAFHVLVIVLAQAVPPDTSLPTCCTVAPLQASLAVGGVNDGVAVHSIVELAAGLPIVGAWVSTIVIV
jgi:hypothetical protein